MASNSLCQTPPSANKPPGAEGGGGAPDPQKHFVHGWSACAGKQSTVATAGEETGFPRHSEFAAALLRLNKEPRSLQQSHPKEKLVANNPSGTPSTPETSAASSQRKATLVF